MYYLYMNNYCSGSDGKGELIMDTMDHKNLDPGVPYFENIPRFVYTMHGDGRLVCLIFRVFLAQFALPVKSRNELDRILVLINIDYNTLFQVSITGKNLCSIDWLIDWLTGLFMIALDSGRFLHPEIPFTTHQQYRMVSWLGNNASHRRRITMLQKEVSVCSETAVVYFWVAVRAPHLHYSIKHWCDVSYMLAPFYVVHTVIN